ncbi:MAG: LysM peptidoglycan-binding domain-containing protein [Anaerolineae bacterium]|nr:MAG: LysM peptidoglycan-binding domain-containing protein [Anaerolineae bacterium]
MCEAELPSRGSRKPQIVAAAPVTPVVDTERTCPTCGAPVARKAKKCLMCGALLTERRSSDDKETAFTAELVPAELPPADKSRHCPACGAPVAGTADVCLMCGADLEEETILEPEPARAGSPPLWLRLLRVTWAVVKLPLAAVLAGGILLGIGLLITNQPWKSVPGVNLSPLETALVINPLVTPIDTPTKVSPTDTATPTHTPTHRAPTLTPTFTATPTDTPTATATATTTPTPVPIITYTVQSGDSWISIADAFRVEAVELALFNGRSIDDVLKIDEVLRIPPPGDLETLPAPEHVVLQGDSLERIAQRYGVSVEAIRIANNLPADHVLKVGEVIIIPLGTPTPPTPTPTDTSTPTLTPTPTSTPTATTTPWPDTPTPISGYPTPALLTPPDGEVIEGQNVILLTWASVGLLADDEWYVLHLRVPGNVEQPEEVWTKTTSWRVPVDLRPAGAAAEEPLTWQVVVMRLLGTSADGLRQTETLSPLSETKAFYWH